MCASEYCFDHWQEGMPESRLTPLYLKRRKRMLNKYPLPEGWTEVYEAGMGRHYYWCPETDEVSWLSPRHPHAVIGESAPKMAKELAKEREKDSYLPPPVSVIEETAIGTETTEKETKREEMIVYGTREEKREEVPLMERVMKRQKRARR
ncbi:hypothetical protein PENTCL1PPCAC_17850 [Pristionchus entomophagus]|uniref:WW domain-containing protein n=1 Tax=Pristionchus entomophagus TaxID=358040 RepID=A0AAV5TML4_9BILA|nr:hypothetical protein PENTCL1PPCAC_17850 [Pristionchus entomophagus]